MSSTHSPYLKHLFVCVNKRDPGVTCCSHGGGEAIREKLKAYVKANGLKGKVRVSASGCMDLCAQGPNVMVEPDHRWYRHVTLENIDQLIELELAPLTGSPVAASQENQVPIRAFLFDLGNVLVQFDHRVAARKIAAEAGTTPEELYRLFFDSPLIVDHDEGRISTQTFYERLKEQLGLTASFDKFLDVWNNIFTENVRMTALVRQLLGRYPCFLISNTCRAHFDFCRKEYPILNELTGWTLSFEVGALKPHPAIYHRALELIRLPPSEIFYVDDREDLIQAAGQMGFQTHRFVSAEALTEDLMRRGIDGQPSIRPRA